MTELACLILLMSSCKKGEKQSSFHFCVLFIVIQNMPLKEMLDKLVLCNLKVQEKKYRRAKEHDSDIQICKMLLLKGWEPSLLHNVVSIAGLEIH